MKRHLRHKHTRAHMGKRVAVILKDGTVIEDRFVTRAKNRRWILLENSGKVSLEEIKAFAEIKGPLDLKRLGIE